MKVCVTWWKCCHSPVYGQMLGAMEWKEFWVVCSGHFPFLCWWGGLVLYWAVYIAEFSQIRRAFPFFICHWNRMQSRQKGCGWINVSHILLFFQVQYLYFLPPIATIVEWEFEQLWWFTVIHLRTDFSWSKVQRTPANLWFVICNFIRLRILLSYFLGGEPILPY